MKAETSNSRVWQTKCISALAFSLDAAYCALATKEDHTVRLYRVASLAQVDAWTLLQEFTQHTQTISDIDWATDRKIITSSHDRSVVVWRQLPEVAFTILLVIFLIKTISPSSRKQLQHRLLACEDSFF